MKEAFTGTEDNDLQGFPKEEIRKSKILDIVYATASFKNAEEDNITEWLQGDACELGFQHMTDTVSATTKQKGEEDDREDDSKGER
jgi:hypothetical protein